MKKQKLIVFVAATLCCSFAFGADWLTDGGNTARSGWQKDEHTLTKENVKNAQLLWKMNTGETPRALHSLITPLVVQGVPTSSGPKEMLYVAGVSDNLFAIDSANGKVVWQKHFTYPAPPPRPGGRAPAANVDPRHFNFLNPNGSSDTPVIGPADAKGNRSLYMVDGGGFMHTINIATGEETKPTVELGTSKFALQLYNNMVIAAGRAGIMSTRIDDASQAVTKSVGFGGGGGLWGRRGPVIDSAGVVWTTTGDGQYNVSNPNSLIIGNSVVGFQLQDGAWKVKDWFTPPNWDWLRKRDLDPNNTPTVFNYKGRELMAASGKECRVYLIDPKNAGGADHHEPLYKTPLFCNEAVDFQNAGSWGALSSWEDSNGTRWILVPFWGPAHSQFKFPITNSPATVEGGEAAFKLTDTNGKLELAPVWVSRDMHRGEPPIIANGMIFAYGSGENTQQAWTDIGLNFDSSIRAAKSGHAVIYVLDAMTGKELWSSGDQITSFSHFSGITVANGKMYLGTYDGNLYCFGLPSAAAH
jgi:outer membrane protein assembly factor BamB